MKRIFFIKSRMHKQGGLEKYLDRLARLYVDSGHEVVVLTSSSDVIQTKSLYKIISLMKPCSSSWLHMILFDRKVRQYLSKTSADIVFGFDRHFLPVTHYRAGNGCHRAYLAIRSQRLNPIQKALLWLNPLHWATLLAERSTLLNPMTEIICNSHMVRDEFVLYYPGVNIDHLHVIHNGVEWSEFETPFLNKTLERQEFCVERGLDFRTPHILFIGNEWRRKGVEPLLRGLAQVDSPFQCTIVGKEKGYRYFQELVVELGLQDKVDLIPSHEKAIPWYQRADILAIPSLYDPFANVTTEALAMGLFVISSSSNGGSEVLVEGQTGMVLPALDSKSIAQAVEKALKIIGSSPDLKASIRANTRRFDFSDSLRAYEALL